MIDLLVEHGGDPARDTELLRALANHEEAVKRSARRGDVRLVGEAESAVRADPGAAFAFDAAGVATLSAGGRRWQAGRFEPASLGALRARAAAARGTSGGPGCLRLWVVDGSSAQTDIGSLQAHGGAGTLFQVASQFNCLEAPGPSLTAVEHYLSDPTQGPRASISALPGTLLRHYAAPGAQGDRFVQTNDGRQIELLGAVLDPGVGRVVNGYLLPREIRDPRALLSALETGFNDIRVGAHDGVEVVLGYDWSGGVEGSQGPRIGQVFTSTLAGGAYGSVTGLLGGVCQQLLRAAYLGTLLAAVCLERPRVVLTLIGGGVFGNPPHLIWDAITWALDQVAPLAPRDLTVVVNGRDIGRRIDAAVLLGTIRARNGMLLSWPRSGAPTLRR
jgi:hypothetical protein